jgi:NAD-dependent deacetylase
MKKIVVLTGAGISAESGIRTFRDADGLWEGHDVMKVASPKGWDEDPALVLDFYNQRRRQLKEVTPNAAHHALVRLEEKYDVVIVTQNVDNLHERAGSSRIIHLHGELNKVRSEGVPSIILEWEDDVNLGDLCPNGFQLRPHIVWFGESVPLLGRAADEVETGDIIIIVGTSMQVYPAAGLIAYAPKGSKIYFVDPKPQITQELRQLNNLRVIAENATTGVTKLVEELMAE